MAKKSYTDAERANALAVLQSNDGNVLRTSKATGIPRTTLITWSGDVERQTRMPEVERARFDLADVIERELQNIFEAMATKRADASYRELATAAGILIDKLRLLTGKATAHGHTRMVIEYDDGPEDITNKPKLQAPAEGGE